MAYNGRYSIAIRILLLKKYFEANAGRNRYVIPQEIHDYLKEYELDVEKKALYADFAVLGDVFGLQLEYDPHKKGYRLLNPPFEPYELRLMVDSIQSSKFITQKKAQEISKKIKALADAFGFVSDMKLYKQSPENFKGSVADISMFLRIAVTGKLNSPDMYAVMQVLGKDKVAARISAMIEKLEK